MTVEEREEKLSRIEASKGVNEDEALEKMLMGEWWNMELKQGTKFKGNNNNDEMQIKEIQGDNAVIVECNTGKTFFYGLGALKRCAITILEQP